MTSVFWPRTLTWGDVDPRRHPFDSASALAVVSALEPATRFPTRPAGTVHDQAVVSWSRDEARPWTDAMTEAMVARFGRWAVGWRFSANEPGGGGPVGGWCCPRDSVTTAGETLGRVAGALCEWRGWLEGLAERFERFPLSELPVEDREDAWERAAVVLVTHVVDHTGHEDAWYQHCAQVLTWFLTRWGVAEGDAEVLVEEAIGGRFESWVEPDRELVRDVAERLAISVEADRG